MVTPTAGQVPTVFTSNDLQPAIDDITEAASGTYTFTATTGDCSSSAQTVVSVGAAPVVTADHASPICAGETLQLTGTTDGGTFEWTGPNGFTSSDLQPAINNITVAGSGTYTFTATIDGCSSSAQTVVSVGASPVVTAGHTSPVCAGGTLQLTGTTDGGTYGWTGPNDFTSNDLQPVIANVTTARSGTYIFTAAIGGCSSSAETVVSVGALPVILAATATPDIICSGGNSQLGVTLPAVTGHCSAASTNTSDEWISNVTFAGIDNSSGSTTYSDFTAITANVSAGNSYPFSASIGINGSYLEYVRVYIDWDHNGTWSTDEIYNIGTCNSNGCVVSSNIAVPAGALDGPTRMRVVLRYNQYHVLSGCGTFQYGEVEDYTVEVSDGTPIDLALSWSPTTFLNDPFVADPIATAVTETIAYTVTATNAAGCSATASVEVVAGAPLMATLEASGPAICAGEEVTLTALVEGGAEPYNYNWSSGGATTAQITVSPDDTTEYTVTVYDACEGEVMASYTVNVKPAPTAMADHSIPICVGGTLELTGTPGIGTEYSWTGPGFTSNDLSPSISNVSYASNGTYTFISTLDGCASEPATTVVEMGLQGGVVVVTPDPASICAGGSVELTASGADSPVGSTQLSGTSPTTSTAQWTPYYRNWENVRVQYVIQASELSAFSSQINSIAFNVTNAPGSPSDNWLNGYTIKMAHTASTTAAAQFNGAMTTVFGPVAYSPVVGMNTHTFTTPFLWDGVSNVVIDICFENDPDDTCPGSDCYGNIAAVSVHTAAYTSSRVRYSDNTPQCGLVTAAGAIITSAQRPVMTFGYGSSLVPTYTWSPAHGLDATAGATVTASPMETTTYTVTGTLDNVCSSSTEVTVTVGAPLQVDVEVSEDEFCAGESTTLTAVVTGGGEPYSHLWTPGGATTAVITVSPSDTTEYSVTVTDACAAELVASQLISVKPTPGATADHVAPVCAGGTLELVGTSNIGTAYAWTGPDGFESDLPAPGIANVTAAASGTYTFTATLGDCSSSATTSVTVGSNAGEVVVTPADAVISQCGSVELTASGFVSPTPTTASLTGTDPINSTGSISPYYRTYENRRTQYLVHASELQALGVTGAIHSLSFQVTVAPTPNHLNGFTIRMAHTTATAVTAANPVPGTYQTVLGPVDHSPVVGTNTHAFTTPFEWNGVSNVVIDICFENDPTPDNTCTATTGGICTGNDPTVAMHSASYTGSWMVRANDLPRCGSFVSSNVISMVRPVMTFGYIGPVAATYTWSPAAGLDATTGATVTASPLETTTYTVTGTLDNGCSSSTEVTVTIGAPLAADLEISEEEICAGESTTLTAVVSGGGEPYSYLWTPGGATTAEITVAPSDTTGYSVTVTDACLAEVVLSKIVFVKPTPGATADHAVPVCAGGTLELIGASDLGTDFFWSGPNGFESTGLEPSIADVTAAASGIYTFTATFGGCSSSATTGVVVGFNAGETVVTPSEPATCPGSAVELTASGDVFPTPMTSSLAGTNPTTSTLNVLSPYYRTYENRRTQYLVHASELVDAGVSTTITSLSFQVTFAPTPNHFNGYTIKMAHTTETVVVSANPITTGLQTVYGPLSYSPVVGTNTHTFSMPFSWDGTSNVVIDICFENDPTAANTCTASGGACSGNNPGVALHTAPFTGSWMARGNDAATRCGYTGTSNNISATRPVMTFGYIAPVVATYTWSPADGLNTTTGATVMASPTETTTYTVTGTLASGCNTTAEVTVTVTPVGTPCDAGTGPGSGVLDANCNCVVPANYVDVVSKVVLDGAYDAASGLMRDDLRSAGLIPATQPYGAAPFNYSTGTETVDPAVLANADPATAVVDWVLLELRDATDVNVVVARRAALLQRNGNIRDTDGAAAVRFPDVAAGNYRLVVRHRNHMPVITANSYALGTISTEIDLTSATHPVTSGLINPDQSPAPVLPGRKSITGLDPILALWGGNARITDKILAYFGAGSDRQEVLDVVGSATPFNTTLDVYSAADVNMDGKVEYFGTTSDRQFILDNVGSSAPFNILALPIE